MTLSSVTLDELVRDSALLTRFDRKYLVPATTVTDILHGLDPATRVLEIDGRRTFSYDSVYFDTPDRLAHRLTAHRHRHRFKVRTRSYLDTGTCFFEVKTKNGRGQTVKDRISYASADRLRITDDARDFVAGILKQHRIDDAVVDTLRPSLISRYRRMTVLLPCGSRATFDTDLSWQDRSGRTLTLDQYAIVETKSTARANDLDRMLWRAGCRPSGLSKFGTGAAALCPELPRNKWARTLSGPLNTTTTFEGIS